MEGIVSSMIWLKILFLFSFIRTRWFLKFKSRAELEKYQFNKLKKYFKKQVPLFSFYSSYSNDFSFYPIIQKDAILDSFEKFNAYKITREEALEVALKAEKDRDFAPFLDGITVGLSSGTSGKRGIFLASAKERFLWAGIILAKVLSSRSLKKIVNPFQSPLKIAFFLRSNSNLYTTLKSSRVQFEYFDLTESLEVHVQKLKEYKPQILIAPSSVLVELARTNELSSISFFQVISVAEVLDNKQRQLIESRLNIQVQEIYQCTEGFLGYTCSKGSLHLNEDCAYFEQEWIDEERFYPIITDFTRETQAYIRYKLNDIIKINQEPCSCKLPLLRIQSIEGREDEVLWFLDKFTQKTVPIFPDTIRQIMFIIPDDLLDYRIVQDGNKLLFYLKVKQGTNITKEVISLFESLCNRFNVMLPDFQFMEWYEQPLGEKKRRIRHL